MSDFEQKPGQRDIDAYLDGTLDAAARAHLERRIAAEPELRREIELQRRIDLELRQRFQPPADVPDFASILRAEQAPILKLPPSRFNIRRAGGAAAAAVVLVAVGWYFFGRTGRTEVAQLPLATIYQQTLDEGFEPSWVCKDNFTFASTFAKRQGQGMLLTEMPKGTKMVGLSYRGGLGKDTTSMLAMVNRAPVMVFVDQLSRDSHPAQPAPESGLHLFRKELAPLVLYEITPLDEPTALNYLYLADVPPPDTKGVPGGPAQP